MSLPTKGFKWMTEEELQDWKNYTCILEVDLEYPKEPHDLHNEYPLAPERLEINKVEKLIPNLNNKTSYVLYYKKSPAVREPWHESHQDSQRYQV